jgi:hypothetical protein
MAEQTLLPKKKLKMKLSTESVKLSDYLVVLPNNHPYGLVWVGDVDGPSVYELIEQISNLPILDALPPTLTILSGKAGRERRLYKVSKENKSILFVTNTHGPRKGPWKNLKSCGSGTKAY